MSVYSTDSTPGARGVWEEYRYDALGRRVATRSVRSPYCPNTATECRSYIERTVWDGDQILYEMRTPDSLPYFNYTSAGSLNAYGAVVYLHGPGIDQPLTVTRLGLSGYSEYSLAPYSDMQGVYKGASTMAGGDQAACAAGSSCPIIDWPWGGQTQDGLSISGSERTTWWGSLLQAHEGSGLKYQRNRYYDPTTGQFTKQDPIGLAGGPNLYAFASGDPVNFRDPYGLCPEDMPLCQFINRVGRQVAPLSAAGENGARIALGVTGAGEAMDAIASGDVVGGGVAIAAMFPVGRGAKLARGAIGAVSKYEVATKRGARMWNRATDVDAVSFADGSMESGFSRTNRVDGLSIFTKGDRRYVLRGPERSNSGSSADVYVNDVLQGKIRLGRP